MISIIINLPGDPNPNFDPGAFGPSTRSRQRFASVASMRLQFFPLIDAIKSKNIPAIIHNISSSNFNVKTLIQSKEIMILKIPPFTSKSNAYENTLRLVYFAKKEKKSMSVYYGDNYIAINNRTSGAYQAILKNCGAIASHSSYLNSVAKSFNSSAYTAIIPDPSLLQKQPFGQSSDQSECRIVWFGQGENLKYLLEELENIMKNCKACKSYTLSILSRKSYFDKVIIPVLSELKRKATSAEMNSSWNIRLVPWDDERQPYQLEEELGNAHISFIPSDPNNLWKKGASTNRLVDSIQSGCIVVCSPLESYRPFKDLTLQGEDFPKLIDTAWRERLYISKRIENAREDALGPYSATEVQKKWLEFLN